MAIFGWLVITFFAVIGSGATLACWVLAGSTFGGKSEFWLAVILSVACYFLWGVSIDNSPYALIAK